MKQAWRSMRVSIKRPWTEAAQLTERSHIFLPAHLRPKEGDYKQYAEECRKLAAVMRNPAHKKQLQEMSAAWEAVAKERDVAR